MAMDATLKMDHAQKTALDYMKRATFEIDEKFGDGYSKAHPELVAAFMQTAALDYLANYGMEQLTNQLRIMFTTS